MKDRTNAEKIYVGRKSRLTKEQTYLQAKGGRVVLGRAGCCLLGKLVLKEDWCPNLLDRLVPAGLNWCSRGLVSSQQVRAC